MEEDYLILGTLGPSVSLGGPRTSSTDGRSLKSMMFELHDEFGRVTVVMPTNSTTYNA